MSNTVKNLNSRHLDAKQVEVVNKAIETIENAMKDILVNLSPEERRRYGSISEQNKLVVNKIYEYHRNQPDLSSSDIDWDEFEADYQSRVALENILLRLQKLLDGMNNAKTLFDYDNYQAALDEYSYATYKARTNTPGFENKVKELKQFFTRTRKPQN